jgi:hypothetical protein
MSSAKFCLLCNRNVIPTKSFNGVVFLILFVLGIVPGVLYLFYYILKSKKCPICKSTSFSHAKADLIASR